MRVCVSVVMCYLYIGVSYNRCVYTLSYMLLQLSSFAHLHITILKIFEFVRLAVVCCCCRCLFVFLFSFVKVFFSYFLLFSLLISLFYASDENIVTLPNHIRQGMYFVKMIVVRAALPARRVRERERECRERVLARHHSEAGNDRDR